MPNPNQTIPPVNRRSGMWASMRDHAAKKNGGWKMWASALVGGSLIAGVGVGVLKYFTAVPWYIGIALLIAGVQIGSRGAFIAALKPLKETVIDLLRAKKE